MTRMTGRSALAVWLACVASTCAAADPEAAAAPAADQAAPVKQVEIDPTTANSVVCRRYVPTGSRIAEKRCRSSEQKGAESEAERAQARRDVAEMRERQILREQARAHALAEAMRRRGAP